MYSIAYNDKSRIMTLRLEGFWNAETMEKFLAELFAQSGEIRDRQGGFNVMCDSRDFPVQSAAITDGLEQVMRAGVELVGGFSAVVFGSLLAKMQAERLYTHPNIQLFLNIDDAYEWLARQPLPQK